MGMREAYQEKVDAQLYEWHTWIEKFKADPAFADSTRLPEQQRIVDRLEDCYRIARLRLDELRISQDGRWDFTKQAVERAMIDLKKILDESGAGHAARLLRLQAGGSYVYEPFHQRKG